MKDRDEARGARRLGRALRERLSYANVMSTIAVFGVLAGGGAYAASKIGPKDIKRNAVRAKHIKKNQVRTKHIRRGAVTKAKLAAGVAVSGPKGDKGDPGFSADCNQGLAAGDVMVRVGSVCIDRYEASIWTARTGGNQITGAIPCNPNGQDCDNIYARSVAGVTPRADITWFQAQQALANSGKRLPSNAEWQMAVAGTPDSTACNLDSFSLATTGANAGCVSNHGANDMVGNLWEWVADWDEQADGCSSWPAGFGADLTCFGDGTPSRFPGALIRGGVFESGAVAGPFAVNANARPSSSSGGIGFRGAR
jgi:formylglycine-generating enzyme required for sulfatase activity